MTPSEGDLTTAPEPAPAPDPAPTEWRRLHPLTVIFRTVQVARQLIFPAVAGGVSVGGGDAGRMVTVIIAVLAIPSLIAAIARYITFRFGVVGDELVYRSGVLRRQQRVIPIARVQNIEVRQGPIQRLTSVAELRVETASGGAEPEASFAVIGLREAVALRDALLGARSAQRAAARPAEAPAPAPDEHVIARLTPPELAIAGATANEAGLIAAALVGALQFVDDLPIPLEQYIPDPADYLAALGATMAVLLVAGAVVLLFVVGWVFSVVGSVVGYHDFTLVRRGDELHKRYGFFSRREANVPLRRVQAVRVEESLLRRPLGLAALRIETAGGPASGQRGGAEAFVPIAHARQVPGHVRELFPDVALDDGDFHPVHPFSRRRAFLRYAAFAIPATVAGAILGGWLGALGLLIIPLAYAIARWQYRHRGYRVDPRHVLARGGVLNRVTWIVPDEKIQTLHLRATPFQRRRGLADLLVDTASGGSAARIPDLPHAEAAALLQLLADRQRAARARRRVKEVDAGVPGSGGESVAPGDQGNGKGETGYVTNEP